MNLPSKIRRQKHVSPRIVCQVLFIILSEAFENEARSNISMYFYTRLWFQVLNQRRACTASYNGHLAEFREKCIIAKKRSHRRTSSL